MAPYPLGISIQPRVHVGVLGLGLVAIGPVGHDTPELTVNDDRAARIAWATEGAVDTSADEEPRVLVLSVAADDRH